MTSLTPRTATTATTLGLLTLGSASAGAATLQLTLELPRLSVAEDERLACSASSSKVQLTLRWNAAIRRLSVPSRTISVLISFTTQESGIKKSICN